MVVASMLVVYVYFTGVMKISGYLHVVRIFGIHLLIHFGFEIPDNTA